MKWLRTLKLIRENEEELQQEFKKFEKRKKVLGTYKGIFENTTMIIFYEEKRRCIAEKLKN